MAEPSFGGVVHLSGRLGGPGDDVDIDEAGLAGGPVVTIGQRDYDSLVQPHNQLGVVLAEEGVEEADLERAGVGKEILDTRSFHLGDDEFPSSPTHLGGALAVLGRFERCQERLGGCRCETQSCKSFEESAAGEVVVKVAGDQLAHGSLLRSVHINRRRD